ncbi:MULTISPECIES: DUF2189 domain-containing protein [Pseudophaeobacter]|uniref:DUF2189 domain-containing protein n=1 Tax=Pseudophaeobacter TaxID=1541822 RepID=UPI002430DF1E|nr:DUF2189 domain-containing protein [Pseudophaeobacter profundi]
MAHTIGNPLSWLAQHLGLTSAHVSDSVAHLGSDETTARPELNHLEMSDLRAALKAGVEDFAACRSDAMFLILCYPLIGLGLVIMSLHVNMLPLIFPLILGFALLGPAASVGLYMMSARRAAGFTPRWGDAFEVLRSPALLSVLALGFYLAVLFTAWLMVANAIYNHTLGPEAPSSLSSFLLSIVQQPEGWQMIFWGGLTGAIFAITALAVSLVSFPLLLERNVGLPVAVITSVRLVRRNPRVTLTWGAFVALAVFLGSLPAFAGLVLVIPILGHASWHLYRRAVR